MAWVAKVGIHDFFDRMLELAEVFGCYIFPRQIQGHCAPCLIFAKSRGLTDLSSKLNAEALPHDLSAAEVVPHELSAAEVSTLQKIPAEDFKKYLEIFLSEMPHTNSPSLSTGFESSPKINSTADQLTYEDEKCQMPINQPQDPTMNDSEFGHDLDMDFLQDFEAEPMPMNEEVEIGSHHETLSNPFNEYVMVEEPEPELLKYFSGDLREP